MTLTNLLFLYWSCLFCTSRVPWTPENIYFCAFPGNCKVYHIFAMRRRFGSSCLQCFLIGSLLNSFLFLLFISWKNNGKIKRKMDFESLKQFLLFLITYLKSITIILLLTGTIEIVNNRNILTDKRDERKYLERKYNKL